MLKVTTATHKYKHNHIIAYQGLGNHFAFMTSCGVPTVI